MKVLCPLHANNATGWKQMMKKTAAPVTSPDKKYTAFIKNHNIYVKENSYRKEKQLSLDGTLGNYYSAYIRWSPDSKKSRFLQDSSGRKTLCILCGILPKRSPSTQTPQTRVCQTGR